MFENECDVFIAGSGISGLYAAIALSKIGLSVQITDVDDKKKRSSSNKGLLQFSPRSLQLLKHLDLLTPILEKGIRHWKFEVYQNKGYGNQSTIVDQQSIRLWENDTTEFNYSITIEKSIVHEILKEHLKKEGVEINYKQELINIEENKKLSDSELALYYQYRPLPILPTFGEQNDRTLKSIHLKDVDTEEVKVWKSQAIIGADGQTSFVRQKLGVALRNYSPQQSDTRIFYTLQINIISTNFPGVRHISTLRKNKDILYIIGHGTKLFITFEHRPSWSKLSIDDEIPVSVAKRHIKAVLEPYQMEFGKVKSYHRWQGNNTSSCEEFNFESSFFFIGSAAHCMNPPGIFDVNMNFEQVQNLCWKLALSLQHSASPKLLETFEQEMRLKSQESMQVSTIFINLIGDYYKVLEESDTNNLNASHTRDLIYQLRRFKHCFVGTTPLLLNILNHENHSDDDLLSDEHTSSSIDINSSTPSFEFIGPPTTTENSLSNTNIPLNLATAGCLAPNAKLKPYTLFQLLLGSTSKGPPLTVSQQQQFVSPPSSPIISEDDLQKRIPAAFKENIMIKSEDDTRKRSNSVTTANGSNAITNIWSVLPLFQKGNSNNNNSSSSNNNNAKKRSSITDVSITTVVTTTLPTASLTTTPASALISAERWKSIRTNHIQLMDRIQSLNRNGCTFTILIFCGSMTESQEKTKNFVKLLSSPISFLQQYERIAPQSNRNSSASYNYNDHRSSISSSTSLKQSPPPQQYQSRASFDQPRRESFESFSVEAENRFSMSTLSSSNSSSTFHNNNTTQQPLFSLLFVSSSTKVDATKYLNNTPPATVHSTFPCGLAQVLLDHDGQCYRAYNIKKQTEVVVIRPDGYIGTRVPITQEDDCFDRLNMYFDSFLRPPVDMNTAAAVVAAGYDC